MDNYKLHQVIASISVTVFIMSVAVCIMVCNRSVYDKTFNEYIDSRENDSKTGQDVTDDVTNNISEFETRVIYKQLADSFTSFFSGDYKLAGYELSGANIEKLRHLKAYYRWAWIMAVVSLITGMRSFAILAKRRLYMPLTYGALGSIIMTGIFTLVMALSGSGMGMQLKNMIFKGDYSYFSEGDVLISIFPPDYARNMLLFYIAIIQNLALLMVLIRGIIIFCGRPHKF